MTDQLTGAKATTAKTHEMSVAFVEGEAYEVTVRGHRTRVDQPRDAGGEDTAPTPTELFVTSLATCVAFYAGRYLTRHKLTREGLGVRVGYRLATDRPARVEAITLTITVPPSLPEDRRAALLAVASHCTVHNSITTPPAVDISLA